MTTGTKTYSSAIEHAHNYSSWILDAFEPYIGRRVLEIGLGHGALRSQLPPLERYVGVDIDAESIADARRRYPGDTYLVADIAATGLKERIGVDDFDTVLCLNVLEHVEQDAVALSQLLSVVKPGGYLSLFVPAFPALYSDMDRLAGHWRRYTRSSIDELAARCGAHLVVNRYFNAVGGVGWWINKFGRHRSLDDRAVNRQIELFDRWLVPISRNVDHVTSRFFGQSLVGVFQKQ